MKENAGAKELTQEENKSPQPQEPVAGSFPLNDGSRYDVTENALAELQRLYPGVDAKQELNKIIGWCEANQKYRKTRTGAKRFLNSWFSRAQDSATKTRTQKQKPEVKKNGFHNFEQRDTDYDALATQRIRERLGNG